MTRLGHTAFVLTSLLGAYLLFLAQPLMATRVLPWVGRTPPEGNMPAPVLWTDALSPLLPVITWQ